MRLLAHHVCHKDRHFRKKNIKDTKIISAKLKIYHDDNHVPLWGVQLRVKGTKHPFLDTFGELEGVYNNVCHQGSRQGR